MLLGNLVFKMASKLKDLKFKKPNHISDLFDPHAPSATRSLLNLHMTKPTNLYLCR